ncbi:MAG: hypothetical protein KDK34_15075 [Leptospiraceae bacterium]|nr:hypothetical protein [Leptospiraceae bacterium]
MRIRHLLIFFYVTCALLLYSHCTHLKAAPFPASGLTSADFIPNDWALLYSVTGDLNADGRDDLVLVVDGPAANENETSQRVVLILEKPVDGYVLAARSHTTAFCRECGGVFGDPSNPPDIQNGVLTISNYGGSAWRWGVSYSIRKQQGNYTLIGYTSSAFHAASEECTETEVDFNLSTGRVRLSRQTGRQGNCRDIEKWINRPIPAPYLLKNETDWKLPSESDYPDFFNAE